MRDLAAAGAPVYGWNRSAATANAAAAEGFDASTDLAAVLRRAQEDRALLVIGVPMFAVGGLLDQIAELAPDCGMKYLPRAVAYGKLRAMVAGRDIVRKELGG